MLRLIGESLDLSGPSSIVVWAGLILAFFFLLRCSEYCEDPTKALRVGDAQFSCNGISQTGGRGADGVLICIKDSKTDQGGQGAQLTAYSTGDILCPVTVAAKVVEMRRSMGATDEEPLLVWSGNAILKRAMVTDVLRWAATELGQEEALYASHSLRIGGASTMLACGFSEEDIRRLGRWQSFCWRRYAHNTGEKMKGVSSAVARSTYTVMTAGQDFLARRRECGGGTASGPGGKARAGVAK